MDNYYLNASPFVYILNVTHIRVAQIQYKVYYYLMMSFVRLK